MDLYLHIGTEKTGSSYMQSMLAVNRKQLGKNGIYFPHAGRREKDLQKGRISPGNAQILFGILKEDRFSKAKDWLQIYYKKAQKKECKRLLLSNEVLCSILGKGDNLSKFRNISKDIGFKSIKFLLLLRNPVDQALSLYKHRAKGGTTANIEKWVHKGYHYHTYLDRLFRELNSSNIDTKCIKYKKEDGYLAKVLFRDWLQVKFQLNPIEKE